MLTGLINLLWITAAAALVCALAWGGFRTIRLLLGGDALRRALARLALRNRPA